jgi:ELWxxDGT repeat protein
MKFTTLFLFYFFFTISVSFSQNPPDLKIFEVKPGSKGSYPVLYTEFKNKLYFAAWDSTHGTELWRIDTSNGLSMLADINPGKRDGVLNSGINPSGPTFDYRMGRLAIANDNAGKQLLFFQGNNGTDSFELYQYDGSATPAKAIDIVPGPNGIYTDGLTTLNNKIYFGDYGPSHSIWEYDPVAHTKQAIFTTFSSGPNSNNLLEPYKGKLYFGFNAVYVWDPTTGNTTVLKNWGNNHIYYIKTIDTTLYIVTDTKLYRYDIGMSEPQAIEDICGITGLHMSAPAGALNSKVYFPCPSGITHNYTYGPYGDCALCEYDPVTTSVKKFFMPRDPHSFATYKGKLYFNATDSGTNFYKFTNHELWEYDGINQPTLTADLTTDTTGSDPIYLTAFGDGVYMTASPFPVDYSKPNAYNRYEVVRFKPDPLSVQSLSFKGEVKLYPNPANISATIELNLPQAMAIAVRLKDMTGRETLRISAKTYNTGKSNITLNLQNMATGVYFYTLTDEGGKMLYSGKVVVSR